MDAGALLPYEESLVERSSLALHVDTATPVIALDVERWLGPADDVDRAALAGLPGPVLDIGCGPGRVVEALTAAGTVALGIDIAPTAIALARERGVHAVRCDVFGAVPLAGCWSAAVLLDGNIGIGGDPSRLLARVATLLRPGGRLVVETDPDDGVDEARSVRFWRHHRPTGPPFPWAIVGRTALRRHAARAGLTTLAECRTRQRAFALLTTPND